MLEELHVRDLALIEEAWLELGPGMTVLSGETGAGKTVLVGALKLLLGERADSTLVRTGAQEAVVEGRFVIGDRERTARRRITADGRSRCYLDGEMATVGGLADAFGSQVDLHGQHDHQLLLQASSHAALFDRFGGAPVADAADAYAEAFARHAEAAAARDRIAAALSDRGRQIDALTFLIDDIDAVSPRDGEDDELTERLPRLRHGERLAQAAAAAWNALTADHGASEAVSAAVGALHRVDGVDAGLDGIAADIARIDVELAEAVSRLREYGELIEHDPAGLDEAESRLAAIAALKKKYGPTLADVLRARADAADRLTALEAGEAGLADAEHAVALAGAALESAAAVLRERRTAVSGAFERGLREASEDLAMPGASFTVSMTDLPRESWTREGPQRIEFLYAPARSETARPLVRIASGGEVSRVMLALKSVLGDADRVPVLVFDEIDAGIGGSTATAVGARLRALSRHRQVLVITHLAQVAAFADAHLVVEKAERDGRAHTSVRPVEGSERVAEVARMLSGTDSDASIAHARELLESASASGV